MRKLLLSALAIAAIGCTKPSNDEGMITKMEPTGSLSFTLNIDEIKATTSKSSSKGDSNFTHIYGNHTLTVKGSNGVTVVGSAVITDAASLEAITIDNLPFGTVYVSIEAVNKNAETSSTLRYEVYQKTITINKAIGQTVELEAVINDGLVTVDLSSLSASNRQFINNVQLHTNDPTIYDLTALNNKSLWYGYAKADYLVESLRFYSNDKGDLGQPTVNLTVEAKKHHNFVVVQDTGFDLTLDDVFDQEDTALKN